MHQYPDTHARGRERIDYAFQTAQEQQAVALMPYFTLGYPDEETSLMVIEAISSYSDILELGLPFSDPIADGPTIQQSTQISLARGTTTRSCLRMMGTLRQKGITVPALLMGYFNPILAYGLAEFVADAAHAGADGLIVPDLPLEESSELSELTAEAGLALISFVSPTSSAERISDILASAFGFVYVVSVAGVTGARAELYDGLSRLVNEVRARSAIPVAVGFGISSPELAARVARYADGVIVGSALIDAVDAEDQDKPRAAERFVRSLRQALHA